MIMKLQVVRVAIIIHLRNDIPDSFENLDFIETNQTKQKVEKSREKENILNQWSKLTEQRMVFIMESQKRKLIWFILIIK